MPQGPGTYGKKVGRPPKKKPAAATSITNAAMLEHLRKGAEAFVGKPKAKPKANKRKPGDPSGPPSGSDATRLRHNLKLQSGKDHRSAIRRVSTKKKRNPRRTVQLTGRQAQQNVDKELGDHHHRMQLLDQKKAKEAAERLADIERSLSPYKKKSKAKKAKKNY